MAQVINTNIASLNAQRNLNNSQGDLNTALERLSTELRINSAKDDAAGLAISERMTSQIRGLNQAARNANDGISLAQTAKGALQEIGNNLQRMREIAVQSRNATNSDDNRAALQKEVAQLKEEINRVATQTSFNGTKLLDGSFNNKEFQVGANHGETIAINSIINANETELGTYSRAEVTSAAATTFTALGAGDVLINNTSIGAISEDTSATARAGSLRDAINAISDQTGVYAVNDTATTITLVSNDDITIGLNNSAELTTTGLTTCCRC